MIPRLLAALAAVLSALMRLHLAVTVSGGVTVHVFVPAVLLAVIGTACAIGVALTVRHLMTFRSSPYPRNRFAT
jgi:hypothetical protein